MKNSKHARKTIAKLAGVGHLLQPPGLTPFLPRCPGKGNYIGLSLGGGNEEAEQSKPRWRAQLLLGMCLAWKPGRLHLLCLFDVHPPGLPRRLPKRLSCSEAAYEGQALFVSKSSADITLP